MFYMIYFGYIPKNNDYDCIPLKIFNDAEILKKY